MRRTAVAVGAAILVCSACTDADEPVAVRVGPAEYLESELTGLDREARRHLARITAFGLATAEGRLDELGRPFVWQERQSLLLQRLAMERSAALAGLDESELRAAYLEDPVEELTVRHLVVLSERWRSAAERAEAERTAQAALERIRAGEPFAEVAAQVSEEPGAAERGGLLESGRRDSWVPEFWSAANALREGEVSPVVETRYGYHVIRLEDRDTVPFDEVRDEVLPRLADFAGSMEQAHAWADEQAARMRLDTAAIESFRSADDTRGDATLARWPGGSYTAADLRRYLRTLEPATFERARGLSSGAFLEFVRSAARNALLADRAEELDIALSRAELRATEENWRQRAMSLAERLGFREGMTTEQVEQTALEALGATGQATHIARAEVLALGPALSALYPTGFDDAAPDAAPSSSSSSTPNSATSS